MDALFFLARREAAAGVTCSRDLPVDPAAEPLRLEEPSPLAGLARVLGVPPCVRPLRDATCRSFPVWELGAEITRRIAKLDDAEVDDVAERWQKHDETALDADLYELATCLGDLREAIRCGAEGESLFVLLEERAW
jgi:hypothetical protein